MSSEAKEAATAAAAAAAAAAAGAAAVNRGKPSLRFQVGDKVAANVSGTFTEGRVIKIWDDGKAYRIKLVESGYETPGHIACTFSLCASL